MDARARLIIAAAVLGSGMVFLDSMVVTVALPAIGAELDTVHLGVLEAQSYVYTGYLLALSALLVPAGALGDRVGRRRMFLIGLVAFAATSALCGLAPSMEALIAFRGLQGAAGAILVPGALAIITAAFEGEARGRAFGIWAGASGATTILGPFVGGMLVDAVSWRAVFFLNIPIAAAAVWATRRAVEESHDPAPRGRLDWSGAALVLAAVGGLTFGAIRGQEQGWDGAAPLIALTVGLCAAIALPVWLLHARHPLVPPQLFRERNFTVTNISTLLIYGGLYAVSYFLVVFLQGTLGYTAAAAGLATVPSVVFLALFSHRFGALAGRNGPRRYMVAGPLIMAVGIALLSRIPPDSAPWPLRLDAVATWSPPADYLLHVVPGQVLYGLGLMVVVAPLTTALMDAVPVRHAGVASAVNNAISRVGPQLATALLFVAAAATFYASAAESLDVDADAVRSQLDPLNAPPADVSADVVTAAREASSDAFGMAMLLAAALVAAGAAVNAAGIRNPDPVAVEARAGDAVRGQPPSSDLA